MPEILYGRQAVHESLRAYRREARRLLLAEGIVDSAIVRAITALANAQSIRTVIVPRSAITRVANTSRHQGVALKTSAYPYAKIPTMLALAKSRNESPLLLVLDLLQDVHNLGSLIRSAEAVGVHGVLIQERRAAAITPAAVNTSAGASEHLLIARVKNLSRAIEGLKETGIWIAGLEDTPDARLYTEVNLTVPLALVVGGEAKGLRQLVMRRCDWLIRIPMRGKVNSLNAAVAGSIALYEVLRQRAYPGHG